MISRAHAGVLSLFFIAVLSLAATGCLKDIKEQPPNLGAEYSANVVQNAVDSATKDISIGNASVGDCVTYAENYRIESDPVILNSVTKHRLLSVTQNPGTVVFNIFEDYYTYYTSGAPKDEAHRQLSIPFQSNSITPSVLGFAGSDNCTGQVKDDGDGVKYDCVRYFNLQSDDENVPAPDAIKNKPGCLGFANCQIPVHHVRYDTVKFLNGKEVTSPVTLDADFSSKIPDLYFVHASDGSIIYTPASTSFCITALQPVDNSKYLVESCSVLQDMQKASVAGDCIPPTP